jgi:hypothetical protein
MKISMNFFVSGKGKPRNHYKIIGLAFSIINISLQWKKRKTQMTMVPAEETAETQVSKFHGQVWSQENIGRLNVCKALKEYTCNLVLSKTWICGMTHNLYYSRTTSAGSNTKKKRNESKELTFALPRTVG